ncbi:MAG: single-stranded-DNA-specific exonuclease RecJ, partial [Candidatus Thioglobus sp.]|nr:single-stranded-DNA-specific exonuclease RecJ [Candidatus Thioglobus sp.]
MLQNRAVDRALLDSYADEIPTFLKKIYAARSVSQQQLSLSLTLLLKPNFEQLNMALEVLQQALEKQKRILIV